MEVLEEELSNDERALLLLGAIGLDNAPAAMSWLQGGAEALAEAGTGPLERACDWGADRCAKMLMDSGWDWRQAQSASGRCALESAAAAGAEACVRACVERSEASDAPLLGKALALAFGRKEPKVGVAKALLDGRGYEYYKEAQAEAGEAMACAVAAGEAWMVRLLLSAGWPADVPLLRPDLGPKIEVELLGAVLRGAVGKSVDGSSWSQSSGAGVTALAMACVAGASECAVELAAAGADVGWRFRSGATPLMLAANSGSEQLVKELLARGADATVKDPAGWSVLMWAAAGYGGSSRVGVIKALIAGGADPGARCPADGKMSALEMFAARYRSRENVEEMCMRVDPRPLLARMAKEVHSWVRGEELAALEAGARQWNAKDERDSLWSASSVHGALAGGGRSKRL